MYIVPKGRGNTRLERGERLKKKKGLSRRERRSPWSELATRKAARGIRRSGKEKAVPRGGKTVTLYHVRG